MQHTTHNEKHTIARRVTGLVVLFLGCLLASATLEAGTITVTFNNALNMQLIDRTVDNGANWYTTDTGLFQFTFNSGGNGGLGTVFYAFCIEPREFISPGQVVNYQWSALQGGTTNIGGMGAAKAAQIDELFGRYAPKLDGSISALQASALQISIWEIVRETSGTLDVYSGTTRYANPQGSLETQALALAETYVTSLDGTGLKLTNLQALINIGVQDVVVQSDAPEPGTCAVFGAGLLALGGLSRKLRRA